MSYAKKNYIEMSKFAIVLCAALFVSMKFDVRALEAEEIVNENSMTRAFDEAIKKIDDRFLEVYEGVIELEPKVSQSMAAVSPPYQERLERHFQTLEVYVEVIILSKGQQDFNATKCRTYFDRYRETMQAKINDAPSAVFYEVSTEFVRLFLTAKETKRNFHRLKAQAAQAHKFATINFDSIRNEYSNSFRQKANQFLIHHVDMANGTLFEERMQSTWDHHVKLGLEVIDDIYKCVFDVL